MQTTQAFSSEFYSALLPELLLFAGLLALILIPNLGKGTFRIPGTQIRLPWLLGGQRFSPCTKLAHTVGDAPSR